MSKGSVLCIGAAIYALIFTGGLFLVRDDRVSPVLTYVVGNILGVVFLIAAAIWWRLFKTLDTRS